jgi:DNA-binding MarR family transcriptional regulator
MSRAFEELSVLSRLIHEPARLTIMIALSACESADFLYLQRLTGLTKGNLSGHLAKLETAGLISIEKSFVEKIPHTQLRLSEAGRSALEEYWQQLEVMRKKSGM